MRNSKPLTRSRAGVVVEYNGFICKPVVILRGFGKPEPLYRLPPPRVASDRITHKTAYTTHPRIPRVNLIPFVTKKACIYYICVI